MPTPKVTRQNSGLRLRLSLPLVNSSDSGDNSDRSPSSVKDVKDKILASSKSILGKVLSPAKEKFARDKVCMLNCTDYTKCKERLNFVSHVLQCCNGPCVCVCMCACLNKCCTFRHVLQCSWKMVSAL